MCILYLFKREIKLGMKLGGQEKELFFIYVYMFFNNIF